MSDVVGKQKERGGYGGRGGRGGRGGKGGRGGNSNSTRSQPAFEANFQKEIKAFDKQLEPLRNENKILGESVKSILEANQKLRAQLKTLFDDLPKTGGKSAGEEQKNILKRKDQLQREKQALQKDINESRKSFSVRQDKMTTEEYLVANDRAIDQEIRDLEAQIRSARDMATNKQLVKLMESTKSKKSTLETFSGKTKAVDRITQELEKLEAQYKENKTKQDQSWEERKKQSSEIDTLKAQVTANDKNLKEVFAKRDANKKKQEEIIKGLQAVREEQNKQWTTWKEEQEVLRKEAKEKKRLEDLAAKESPTESPVVKENAPLPRTKEIKQCDDLIKFLKGIRINKNKPNALIKHNFEIIEQFGVFGLVPPSNGSAVERSVAEVTAKKDNFLKIQQEEVVRREEAAKLEAEKAAAKAAEPAPESAPEAAPEVEKAEEAVEEPKAEEPAVTEPVEENKEVAADAPVETEVVESA